MAGGTRAAGLHATNVPDTASGQPVSAVGGQVQNARPDSPCGPAPATPIGGSVHAQSMDHGLANLIGNMPIRRAECA
jgi:hypothetical protein